MVMHDPSQAEAFLRQLGDGPYVFQTFTDNKEARKHFKKNRFGKPVDPLARVLTGSFENNRAKLEYLSSRGAGVFVQINEGNNRGKKSIKGIRALFVDVDEPKTSKETLEALMKFMPRPTIMVSSSKDKFHVYWKVIDCDLDSFNSMQKQLAIHFASDPEVNNLDRVMRLPGFPHQKKEPFMVVGHYHDAEYTTQRLYDAAAKAPPIERHIKNPVLDTTSADAFGLNINEGYVEPVILPPGNRTGPLISHIGKMVSDGYSPEAIRKKIIEMNVELCPANAEPIDEGTLEYEVLGCIHKFCEERDRQEQAEQQSNKAAAQEAIAPPPPKGDGETEFEAPEYEEQLGGPNTLDAWEERFRYVEQGSRIIDTHLKGEASVFTITDFKNTTQNIKVNGNAFLSTKWLQSQARKSVRDTIFYPNKSQIVEMNGANYWNMYTGSGIVPMPSVDTAKIKPFMDHMKFLFPQEEDRFLFMDWFACSVTYPERRIPWVPLLISEQGAGKGWIYELLSKLLGKENTIMILPERLKSQFNTFLKHKVLVCIDEMHKDPKGGITEKLNHLISESHIELNVKGEKEKSERIFCNLIMFSNNEDAAIVKEGDRRYWVHKIHGVREPEYYHDLWEWQRDSENLAHMLTWCYQRDITKFAYNKPPPQTRSKSDMIENSMTSIERYISHGIETRDGPFGADVIGNRMVVDYILQQSGVTMTLQLEQEIYDAMHRFSKKIDGKVLRTDTKGSARHRVRSIRNHEHWYRASLNDLKHELTRAEALLFGKPAEPPKLKEVTQC